MSDNGALNMSVSPICMRDEKKCAYVYFSDEARSAEGIIPDCAILKNSGFSDSETAVLEEYMKSELPALKKMAANVNVLKAFMGDGEGRSKQDK